MYFSDAEKKEKKGRKNNLMISGSILIHHRPAMPFETEKNILEDLFSSAFSQFKKYRPSGNLKFDNLGIFQSLKLRNSIWE